MNDLVPVYLEDDYYTHEGWHDPEKLHPSYAKRYKTYMIPREQKDRWRQAEEAYEKMQDEIAECLRVNP